MQKTFERQHLGHTSLRTPLRPPAQRCIVRSGHAEQDRAGVNSSLAPGPRDGRFWKTGRGNTRWCRGRVQISQFSFGKPCIRTLRGSEDHSAHGQILRAERYQRTRLLKRGGGTTELVLPHRGVRAHDSSMGKDAGVGACSAFTDGDGVSKGCWATEFRFPR